MPDLCECLNKGFIISSSFKMSLQHAWTAMESIEADNAFEKVLAYLMVKIDAF